MILSVHNGGSGHLAKTRCSVVRVLANARYFDTTDKFPSTANLVCWLVRSQRCQAAIAAVERRYIGQLGGSKVILRTPENLLQLSAVEILTPCKL